MPEIKFLVDAMLGRLAKLLRMLGYDTEYSRSPLSDPMIGRACEEARRILTRNTRLSARTCSPDRICLITSNQPMQQVREVLAHYRLAAAPSIHLTRCLICNRRLITMSPESLVNRVPDYVLSTQQFFLSCPECRRVYWRGTHYRNMMERFRHCLSSTP